MNACPSDVDAVTTPYSPTDVNDLELIWAVVPGLSIGAEPGAKCNVGTIAWASTDKFWELIRVCRNAASRGDRRLVRGVVDGCDLCVWGPAVTDTA